MATLLGDQGYSSLYFHPGNSWFYNRDSALSFLGIDERVFVEDLEDKSKMETSFLKNLKQLVSERTQNGERLFTYATTIQNHQAYTYSKYDFEVPKVQTSVQLSDYAEELLSVYAYGVKCSSDMLLELTEYLNGLDDPYVLVFSEITGRISARTILRITRSAWILPMTLLQTARLPLSYGQTTHMQKPRILPSALRRWISPRTVI